jgi:pyridinium-3,5-biscarboxylic acid mononucleotide sulfurtransferase
VAYGIEVTPHRLARVERAEAGVRAALATAGLESSDLRVRDLGERGSVEVDRDLVAGPLAPGTPAEASVLAAVRSAGFPDAVVDPRGFRSGSLNEALRAP